MPSTSRSGDRASLGVPVWGGHWGGSCAGVALGHNGRGEQGACTAGLPSAKRQCMWLPRSRKQMKRDSRQDVTSALTFAQHTAIEKLRVLLVDAWGSRGKGLRWVGCGGFGKGRGHGVSGRAQRGTAFVQLVLASSTPAAAYVRRPPPPSPGSPLHPLPPCVQKCDRRSLLKMNEGSPSSVAERIAWHPALIAHETGPTVTYAARRG